MTTRRCTHVGVRKRRFLKTITSRAQMLVNAHAPFKDDTGVFSHYCVFVWVSKNDSKPQRVDADVLEKGEKKISVFIRVDGAKVRQNLEVRD